VWLGASIVRKYVKYVKYVTYVIHSEGWHMDAGRANDLRLADARTVRRCGPGRLGVLSPP
jgi:hypothetical protein